MREKLIRFMQGRYGVDLLSKVTMGLALACIVLTMFVSRDGILFPVLEIGGWALIIYTYYRIFSRNISKRYAENQKFLECTAVLRNRLNQEKRLMSQRKTHHIYSCPNCKQKIRIPRGKGKIEIDCPKCHTRFVKRS